MNSKLIIKLLGGGVAILATSFGGIKLNDTLAYNSKIKRYNRLSENFKLKRSTGVLKSYYLPDWDNDVHWKKQYEREVSSDSRGNNVEATQFRQQFPTIESLKEYCFEEAEKDQNLTNCNVSSGWCDKCARDESWG
ncbi:hypothetical protein A6V39_05705 [Candidatus Mycoplasma haematobovis]|uniref:Uncharacterized protein n=1 Tax=Candidatus Mycoplasma haematobovis TaxID=432608 RepID=A0A1A9QDX1_9MOLU|nr:hypothetical protein [Candidatus Mycoplasma haematobovis]OAL10802.1 hypothetical protein A6V39_05705 [Candidatus Mycoplasma haematobovis]